MIIVEEYIKLSLEERQKHLRLDEPCLERGGHSPNHRGVLVVYLETTFPKDGRSVGLLHACGNGKCSNPKHLYWGTQKENIVDAKNHGVMKTFYENCVSKYGVEGFRRMCSIKGRESGKKGWTPERRLAQSKRIQKYNNKRKSHATNQ